MHLVLNDGSGLCIGNVLTIQYMYLWIKVGRKTWTVNTVHTLNSKNGGWLKSRRCIDLLQSNWAFSSCILDYYNDCCTSFILHTTWRQIHIFKKLMNYLNPVEYTELLGIMTTQFVANLIWWNLIVSWINAFIVHDERSGQKQWTECICKSGSPEEEKHEQSLQYTAQTQ